MVKFDIHAVGIGTLTQLPLFLLSDTAMPQTLETCCVQHIGAVQTGVTITDKVIEYVNLYFRVWDEQFLEIGFQPLVSNLFIWFQGQGASLYFGLNSSSFLANPCPLQMAWLHRF